MRICLFVVLVLVVTVSLGKPAAKKAAKKNKGGGKCKGKKKALCSQINDFKLELQQCNASHVELHAQLGQCHEDLAECNGNSADLAGQLKTCEEERDELSQRNNKCDNMRLADVFIRSEGCNDPGKTPETCGVAYIQVDGNEHSPKKRGYDVVVVDGQTGEVLETKGFDTHGSQEAVGQVADYLNGLDGDKYVLVAVQDQAAQQEGEKVHEALKRLGGHEPFVSDYRHSYALVGYAGPEGDRKRDMVIQDQHAAGKGPSVIKSKILIG